MKVSMKLNIKKLITLCSMMLLLMLVACNNNSNNNSSSKTVIATTYAAYDWAKNIIGNTKSIDLEYLVDSSVDLHSYKPSADDIIKYKNADLIICIGGESEEWIEDLDVDDSKILSLIDEVDAKEEEVVEGMQSEDENDDEEIEETEYDEHIWLSLKNANKCVYAILDAFKRIDEPNTRMHESNVNDYIDKLNELDKEYEECVNNSSVNTLLFGDRFPFRYLVDDYGLNYYAAFVGCSAESEASFETISFLSEKINELKLKSVCVISDNHDIANSIIDNADSDCKIIEFNSMQSISNKTADDASYIDIMTSNLNSLKQALEV